MITEASLIASHTKAFVASIGLLGLALADATTTPGTAEDYLIKGGAAGLIIFLIRVILKGWDEHRKSMDDHRATLETTVKANTAALDKVHTALDGQIRFFEGVGKTAIDRAMNEGQAFSLHRGKE